MKLIESIPTIGFLKKLPTLLIIFGFGKVFDLILEIIFETSLVVLALILFSLI